MTPSILNTNSSYSVGAILLLSVSCIPNLVFMRQIFFLDIMRRTTDKHTGLVLSGRTKLRNDFDGQIDRQIRV